MKPFDRLKFRPTETLRWLIPILLIALFLITLIWLPWQAKRMEANERQEQLIADTLWVEQTIQFQINRNDELLRQTGFDIIHMHLTPAAVTERFAHLVHNNHEIYSLTWRDQNKNIVVSSLERNEVSRSAPDSVELEHFPTELDLRTLCAEPIPDGTSSKINFLIECEVPLIRNQRSYGSLLVTYSTSAILDELIPWWFAKENQISIIDMDDNVYATRTSGGVGKNVYTHNRNLDLYNLSLILRTNSNKSEPKLLSNLLVLLVVLLSGGLVWSLIALRRDINRRLAAEGALRQQVMFRSAMENSLVTGLRARDMQGRLTYVNPAFCRMVGYPAEEIIGRVPPMPYWAPEAIPEYLQRFTQLLAGSVPQEAFETIYQHANGERIQVLIYESPLINESGMQTGWMSSILDITELKRTQELSRQQEEKLHASAHLATMGELASMLAHELNQPLAAISSYTTGAVNMLSAGQNDPELMQTALSKVSAQAQRAGQIIRSVHEFVKKRNPVRSLTNMTELIESTLPLIELQAQSMYVQLQWTAPGELPPVLADRVLIEQVLLNLTRNAIEAMQQVQPVQRYLRVHAYYDEKADTVVVEVIDRGHGISKETAEQLFSPFFTTKDSGMGMGLNICRTTIEFHGGQLNYEDNPDGGTIFRFVLPAVNDNNNDANPAIE